MTYISAFRTRYRIFPGQTEILQAIGNVNTSPMECHLLASISPYRCVSYQPEMIRKPIMSTHRNLLTFRTLQTLVMRTTMRLVPDVQHASENI